MELLRKDLTEAIIKVYYDVYNELGYGFLEKVYQNSMFKKSAGICGKYKIRLISVLKESINFIEVRLSI